MIKLTVRQLMEKIKDLPPETEVYLERIEDVYFEKYGWTTIPFFDGENNVTLASQCCVVDDKVLILGHY